MASQPDPAGDLRTAADHIRRDHGIADPQWAFWKEIADWLDHEAEKVDCGAVANWREFNRALEAARGYLLTEGAVR